MGYNHKAMNFLPLHVYTGYSFLRSGMSLPAFVAAAKARGQSHVAISDLSSMTGFPELTMLCQKAGLIPVYAMDLSLEGLNFTFLIKSEQGYRNLMKLALLDSQEKTSLEEIKAHQEGLLVILDLACPAMMERNKTPYEELSAYLMKLSKGFSQFALGIPYLPKRPDYIEYVRGFLQKYPYEHLAFPHIRYLKKGDAIALSIVEAISTDATLEEKELEGDQYYLEDEILSSFYTQEELEAPMRLVEDATFVFEKKRGALPEYPNEEGLDSVSALRKAALEGLQRRVPGYSEEYKNRLNYELSVIERMGYSDYFLIVADYVRYAREHGISVGPGRGSGAGSLVSYSLGIISVDPLKFGLLFERFLNPERQSMPDIDVDFADIRRDEVAIYLQQKYGHDHVAHIVTMQTLGAKASIRDIGRVFGYEPRHIDILAKAIGPNNLSLRQNYKTNAAFRTLVDSDPYYLQIVSLASKVEGLPRQAGLHAAGIVLSKDPLEDIVPVNDNQSVGYVAQYEMNYLEDQGVLKMDLLGLRNLTLVDHCLDLLRHSRGIALDYQTLPYDDPEAIALIGKCKTMGLFQLESAGMNRAISTVKPTSFSDVVAIISLFRPGPMENIPSFARRKAGQEPITYLSPLLEPILKETYGVIVYQEQIMQIVTALAGFSYGQADLFRRAVSKKDATKLAALKDGFINGCLKNHVDLATADKVYELIFKFADYGFNKSHAVAYGMLACQMAYLKAHYPIEFYCAILDGTSSNDPKFPSLIYEIKGSGIAFALPAINKASIRFLPSEGKIMFPLTGIKGMNGNLAYKIVEERINNGPYKDYFDFALRTKRYGLNVSLLVKLVDAGCMDEFGYSRARLRLAADSAIRYAEMFTGNSGQEILLGLDFPRPEIPVVASDRMDDLLSERDTLGLMLSGSPLETKAEEIKKQGLKRLSELPYSKYTQTYAGVVAKCKSVTTKKGTRMAFLTLYDEESIAEVVLFAEVYDKAYPFLKEGTLVKATLYKNRNKEGYACSMVELL